MSTLLLVVEDKTGRFIWQGATDHRPQAMEQFWFENLENFPENDEPKALYFIRVEVDGSTSFQPLPENWNEH